MNKTRTVVTGMAALAAVAALGACSSTATKEASSSVAAPSVQTSSAASAAVHNMADMHFAKMMIPHHEQAIEMSDIILAKQGIDPRVVEIATQIKAAQGPEIQTMQGWITQWGMPGMSGMPGMDKGGMSGMPGMDHGGMQGSGAPSTSMMPSDSMMPSTSMMPSGSMMPGMGGMGDMDGMGGMGNMHAMDGMMSQADMDALKNANGVQAAKLYLTGMIKHHQGALTMAQNEIKNGEFPDAVAMAKSILETQQKEIDTMNQILGSL